MCARSHSASPDNVTVGWTGSKGYVVRICLDCMVSVPCCALMSEFVAVCLPSGAVDMYPYLITSTHDRCYASPSSLHLRHAM